MTQEIDYSKPIIIEYFNYGMSKYTKLIIPPGKLCIIKGENNNGKSCLFYGLEWLLFNDPLAKTLINNKSLEQNKNAALKVKISQDSYFIEITRNMNSISYNINGKIYDKKLNKQSIFDLEENAYVPGFVYVKNCIYPLFNMQGEDRGLFPISENNDQGIYTLFESLLGLINSKKILTAADKEAKELRTRHEILSSESIQKVQKLAKLKDILDDLNIIDIENLITKTENKEKELEKLNQCKKSLNSLVNIQYIIVPNKIDSNTLQSMVQEYSKYLNAKQGLEKAINQIQTVQTNKVNHIEFNKLSLCQKIMIKLQEAKQKFEIANKEQWKLSLEKHALMDALESYKCKWEEIKICPMCKQPIENKSLHIY